MIDKLIEKEEIKEESKLNEDEVKHLKELVESAIAKSPRIYQVENLGKDEAPLRLHSLNLCEE